MKYTLTPLNEGHEMPCCTTFSGSKKEAAWKAYQIAINLTQLLPGNDFAVRIERQNNKGESLRAFPDGKLINEDTGNFVAAAVS
jgi:hypothetical protein